jgi:hypothetical protein
VVRHERGQGVRARIWRSRNSRFIRLQAHREFVEVLCDLMVVVKVLDEVRFAVAIEIAQPAI